MARQISSGLLEPGASMIAAHNETHRAVVALETAKPHYDGPEWISGVEQVLTTFFASTVSTLADAINCAEKGFVLWDTQHSNRHNSGSGLKIYGHKVAGTLLGGSVGASGADLEQAMVDAWGPLAIALAQACHDHGLNVGGTWHTVADDFNVIYVPPSITTKAQLFACVLAIRAWYEAHRNYQAGVVHASGDTTNTVSAAPPDTVDSWDDFKAVMAEVITDLTAHAGSTTYHANAQSLSLTSPTFPSAVSTAFTRINSYKSTHNTDLGSTTIHHQADSTYTLGASNATTVATYITLAEEMRTKQTGHFRYAPVSSAERGV